MSFQCHPKHYLISQPGSPDSPSYTPLFDLAIIINQSGGSYKYLIKRCTVVNDNLPMVKKKKNAKAYDFVCL